MRNLPLEMAFRRVQQGPVDPMHLLKAAVESDKHGDKVDLGVGVYRNEAGTYHELNVLKKVWKEKPGTEFLSLTNSGLPLGKGKAFC